MHKYWERHPHTQLARSNSVSSLSNQHFSQWAKCAVMFIAVFRGFQCAQTNCNPQLPTIRQHPPPPTCPHPSERLKTSSGPLLASLAHVHSALGSSRLVPFQVSGRSSNCDDDDDDGNTCQRLLPADRSVPVAVSITVRALSSAVREQSSAVRPYGDFVEAIDLGYGGAQIINL